MLLVRSTCRSLSTLRRLETDDDTRIYFNATSHILRIRASKLSRISGDLLLVHDETQSVA